MTAIMLPVSLVSPCSSVSGTVLLIPILCIHEVWTGEKFCNAPLLNMMFLHTGTWYTSYYIYDIYYMEILNLGYLFSSVQF